MKKLSFYFLLLWFAYWLSGCGGSAAMHTNNLAHMYTDGGTVIQVQYKVYHEKMDQSRLFFSFASKDLLYVKGATEAAPEAYTARFAITYRLFSDFEQKQLVDSGSVFFEDLSEGLPDKTLSGDLTFKIPRPSDQKNFLLVAYCTDFNRKFTSTSQIPLDVRDVQMPENFLRKDTAGQILFGQTFQLGAPFLLEHNQSGTMYYIVRYYKTDWPMAVPPHVPQAVKPLSYVADSMFRVSANEPIVLTAPGMYHFQVYENSKYGFTLYHFYPEFPYVASKDHLSGPLRYLTNNSEYMTIATHDDTDSIKLEADRFWLKNAGSVERARNLVAVYYGRVESANRFFTSYQEGWKTDRGLIYIIYGPPTAIYKEELTEQWIFGEPSSSLSYVFTFVKVNNPFTTNDYALTRLSSYRYGWGQAVETWRRGQVYGIRDIKREQDERDQQLRMQHPTHIWY
jgi:GWxTD domain-containing protein